MGAFGRISRLATLIGGLLLLTVGICHIIRLFHTACNSNINTCVGPMLFWNDDSTHFLDDSNKLNWRLQIFSLVPIVFLDTWTPVVLGIIVLCSLSEGLRPKIIFEKWSRISVFFLISALYGAFGYAGNLGIITGFYCVLVSLLCLLCSFMDNSENAYFHLI